MPLAPTKTPAWRRFEAYVASLYSSLDYRVQRDLLIAGQQIDLLIERHLQGIGTTRAIVECKFRSSGPVSNQEIQDSISTFRSIPPHDRIDHWIVLSNQPFSGKSRQSAEGHHNVHLLTIEQLEDSLFDLREPFSHFTALYEADAIFRDYILLSGTGAVPVRSTRRKYKNIELVAQKWINADGNKFLAILGDFGAGKTTILRRLKYLYCKDHLESECRLRPLYLELRDFDPRAGLDDFLIHSIRKEYQRFIPLERFWSIAGQRGFLFLLDGFDEIVTGSTPDDRVRLIISLYPLIASSSPAVLTCRPSYFVDDREVQAVVQSINRYEYGSPDGSLLADPVTDDKIARAIEVSNQLLYRSYVDDRSLKPLSKVESAVIEIDTLTPDQVDAFLRKFDDEFKESCGLNWETVRDSLLGIYDIGDLMTRPIILSMIKDTVIHGRIDVSNRRVLRGASDLYEKYTDLYLRRDWAKGEARRRLSIDARRLFAEAIALAMLQTGRLTVEYWQIRDLAAAPGWGELRRLRDSLKASVEELAGDVQVSMFLSRRKETFEFAHKSFMEFTTSPRASGGLTPAAGWSRVNEGRTPRVGGRRWPTIC